MIYAINLIARKNTGFTNIGESIRSDTITFNIQNLTKDRTYQWFIKPTTTTPDINAIAGDTGTIDQSTESITFALPSADFTVGSTYYFALREFDGSASQEVIQVSFTISQNAVLGQGTSVLNISPLFLPSFTTEERDEIITGGNALLIYNETNERIEKYDPITEEWGPLEGGGGASSWGDITGTLSNQTDLQNALNTKQATLVSGTNIKTINNESLLGSGNITISGGGAVDSVNGQTGTVVLDADDISDTATTNKYTTASDISKLAGIEAGAEVNNISDTNATDLTDGGDTTLHNHDSRYYTETEINALDAQNVKLTGNQQIAGDKTFTGTVISGSITDLFTTVFQVIRNNIQIGRITNNASHFTIQSMGNRNLRFGNTSNANIAEINNAGEFLNNATVSQPTSVATKSYVDTEVGTKQNTLVSGTNIKTVNSESLLGSGDIVISGGATMMQTAILTACASADTAPIQQYSHLVTCPSNMTVTKLTVYITALDGTPTVELGIYSESGTRLGTKTGVASSAGFFTVTLDTGVSLTEGTRYYLSLLNQNNPNTTTFLRDTGRNDAVLNRLASATSSMPDPLAAGSATARAYWILASTV
jgi:hypothetical protein